MPSMPSRASRASRPVQEYPVNLDLGEDHPMPRKEDVTRPLRSDIKKTLTPTKEEWALWQRAMQHAQARLGLGALPAFVDFGALALNYVSELVLQDRIDLPVTAQRKLGRK